MKNRPKFIQAAAVACVLSLALHSGGSATAGEISADPRALTNAAFELRVLPTGGEVRTSFDDRSSGLRLAEGPYMYRARKVEQNGAVEYRGLEGAEVNCSGTNLVIRGKLAGLDVEHRFDLTGKAGVLEERILVKNNTSGQITLVHFEAGFVRRVTDNQGAVLPELAKDRWVAIPLRARASDPKGHVNDFSLGELISKPGYEPRVNKDQQYTQAPSRHRHSEGWAWTHADHTLGIFVFNQENMLFSVVSCEKEADGAALRFGGACMVSGEPAALTRIAPGETVDLGTVRYQSMKGDYIAAMYEFRDMLDEKGCRFPRDYNPPVHWEQLYDMSGAWEDRPSRYTKAIVEKEAEKGKAYSCEALYLDPGWDTDFGTFLWGEKWLGPQQEFVQELRAKYDLKLALHCPLATWMSHQYSWGLAAVKTWPEAALRRPPPEEDDAKAVEALRVPAVRAGRRNLALLAEAKARASSVFQGGRMAIHQVEHLNDGWYGNNASWIADRMPAWAEVDLGSVHRIAEVRIGNDHAQQFRDRAATQIRILAATEWAENSDAPTWRVVAESENEPVMEEKAFGFAPVAARWLRVELVKGGSDLPRLDEIEVYEAEKLTREQADGFSRQAKRGAPPAIPGKMLGPLVCLGSKQYREEATRRLLANCQKGAVFLMYDGNWWNGGCINPDHGHPVPYRIEDHTRANLDLAQRVHAKYLSVLIEMHDTVAGGSPVRITPVYYKYGLPGSYDENWGFELMWDPLADLAEARGRSLYCYNLGCNVPIYLHIDLRKDNESCVVLWWFASTCRHLGIGGTSPNPAVVKAQQEAMKQYRRWERFYKRGEFYGINEEIHLHALPAENAFVVNVFNLSGGTRRVEGSMPVSRMKLDDHKAYRSSCDWASVADGQFKVSKEMPPWSAETAQIHVTER